MAIHTDYTQCSLSHQLLPKEQHTPPEEVIRPPPHMVQGGGS